jgi:hypothetical protein
MSTALTRVRSSYTENTFKVKQCVYFFKKRTSFPDRIMSIQQTVNSKFDESNKMTRYTIGDLDMNGVGFHRTNRSVVTLGGVYGLFRRGGG